MLRGRTAVVSLLSLVIPLVPAASAPSPACAGKKVTHLGSSGNDLIRGTSGDDVILARGGDDEVRAGGGDDTVCGGPGRDRLLGGAGGDLLRGNDGRDGMRGGDGADAMAGGGGDDLHDGGGGAFDRVDYSAAGKAITIDLAFGTASGVGADRIANVEGVIGSSGDDTIGGTDGRDFLAGGDGSDAIDGREGLDVAIYVDAEQGVQVDLATGSVTGGDSDTLAGIEGVVGSEMNDVLVGSDQKNLMLGRAGRDELSGAGGNDYFLPGDGADAVDGGADLDVVDFSGLAVTLDLSAGTAVGEGEDVLTGIEGAKGTPHADSFTGDDASNLFMARGGDDELLGVGGDDHLHGGDGMDVVDGGDGTDRCSAETTLACEVEEPSEPTHDLTDDAKDTVTYLKRAH